jgi:outer membrane protein OmpA-like peptidoglycan-associated protein
MKTRLLISFACASIFLTATAQVPAPAAAPSPQSKKPNTAAPPPQAMPSAKVQPPVSQIPPRQDDGPAIASLPPPMTSSYISFFGRRDVTLTDTAKEIARDFAKLVLSEFRNAKITLVGHADDGIDEKENLLLSQRRAESVARYLTTLGVDQSRITARGVGSTDPMIPGPPDPENRRVVFEAS